MKKQTRSLLLVTAIVVVLLGIAQFILRNQTNFKLPNLQIRNVSQPKEAVVSPTQIVQVETVNIDFGNGKKISEKVYTQNAYQALVDAAKQNNLAVTVKQYKYGVMVIKVGDTANAPNSAWMYSVNGKQGQIAADRYVIYPGDKVEWTFSKF